MLYFLKVTYQQISSSPNPCQILHYVIIDLRLFQFESSGSAQTQGLLSFPINLETDITFIRPL